MAGQSGSSINMELTADFYTWGFHYVFDLGSTYNSEFESTGIPKQIDIWTFFYSIPVGTPDVETSDSASSMLDNSYFAKSLAATVLFIVSFIFCIISIFIGLISIRKIENKKPKLYLYAGVVSLISIICFIIAKEFTFSYATDAAVAGGADPISIQMAMGFFGFSFGFFLMIITIILFFLAFIIHYTLIQMPSPSMTQQMYPPSGYKPPQQPNDFGYQYQTQYEKTCPFCGVLIDGNPAFCLNCGNKLK
jgi:hypothetical protein